MDGVARLVLWMLPAPLRTLVYSHRKEETVIRIFKGETLDAFSRELGVSARSRAPDGVRVTRYRTTILCDIHGDFEIFQIACVTAAAADSRAASSCASSSRFLRCPRILLEYQP